MYTVVYGACCWLSAAGCVVWLRLPAALCLVGRLAGRVVPCAVVAWVVGLLVPPCVGLPAAGAVVLVLGARVVVVGLRGGAVLKFFLALRTLVA